MNIPELFKLAKEAHSKNEPEACSYYFEMLIQELDDRAIHHLCIDNLLLYEGCSESIAEQDPEKLFLRGLQFLSGIGLENKQPQPYHAYPYIEKAAELGNNDARWFLGLCYFRKSRITQDTSIKPYYGERAANYFSQAAKKNHGPSINDLGTCYSIGVGVNKYEETALDHFTDAYNKYGNTRALGDLAFSYHKWTDDSSQASPENMKKAYKCYEILTETGSPYAQYCLGIYHEKGWSVSKNLKIALQYYQLAADQGMALALYELGMAYATGKEAWGIEQNVKEAKRLLYQSYLSLPLNENIYTILQETVTISIDPAHHVDLMRRAIATFFLENNSGFYIGEISKNADPCQWVRDLIASSSSLPNTAHQIMTLLVDQPQIFGKVFPPSMQ